MKYKIRKILSCVLIVCVICLSGCSKPNSNSEKLDASTKSYYLKNGYVNFSVSNDLKVSVENEKDLLKFDDDTFMIKEQAVISIAPKDEKFVLNKYNYYINLTEGKILQGLLINGRKYSYLEKDFSKYVVTSDIEISSRFLPFDMVGVSVLINKNQVENSSKVNDMILLNNKISLADNYKNDYELFYAKLLEDSNFDDIHALNYNTKIDSNIVYTYKKNVAGKANYFVFDLEFDENKFQAFIIFKDREHNLYLHEMAYVDGDFVVNYLSSRGYIESGFLNFAKDIDINNNL